MIAWPNVEEPGPERRAEQLVDRAFVFGRERRGPHDHQLAAVGRPDARPAGRVGLSGVDPDRRQPVSFQVARDEHVRDAVDALEVDEPAGAVFGHRHAAEADDFLAGAVDRGRRQDHRAGLRA